MSRPTVGVLGGMGPAATWDFCRQLLAEVPAVRDQDHPRVLVDCDPSLPDRNAAIHGTGPSPAPRLVEMALGLRAAGADLLCMPCNAAHAFADAIRAATPVPFVDMVQATAAAVTERAPGASRAAVLATSGTYAAGLYRSTLAERGITVAPVSDVRLEVLTRVIAAVKAGDTSAGVRDEAVALANAFAREGCEVLVLACTELPLLLMADDAPVPLVASTHELAREVARRVAEGPDR